MTSGHDPFLSRSPATGGSTPASPAFVLLLLVLDLGVFHRTAHVVSFKEATAWSLVWVSLALVFNYASTSTR